MSWDPMMGRRRGRVCEALGHLCCSLSHVAPPRAGQVTARPTPPSGSGVPRRDGTTHPEVAGAATPSVRGLRTKFAQGPGHGFLRRLAA